METSLADSQTDVSTFILNWKSQSIFSNIFFSETTRPIEVRFLWNIYASREQKFIDWSWSHDQDDRQAHIW